MIAGTLTAAEWSVADGRQKQGACADRVAAGDPTWLIEAYYPRILRMAILLTGNASDAEDLAQETFCRP